MGERLRILVASVRFRITVVATLVVALVLTLTAVALVVAQQRQLVSNIDETLSGRAEELSALLADVAPADLSLGAGEPFVQIVVGGAVASATSDIAGAPAMSLAGSGEAPGLPTTKDVPFDDDQFRVLSVTVSGPAGPIELTIGTNLDETNDSGRILATSLLFAIPLVLVVMSLLVWWLVGRTLRPVEAITTEVAEIGGSDLHRRVPEPVNRDEIGRLATTMNQMLDRLEAATERQRRFVGDASHELRTPLTRMKSELEVDLAASDEADLIATHRSALEEVDALSRLVDDLLVLARFDADAPPARHVELDLDDIVLTEAEPIRVSGKVAVDISGVSGAQVVGDAAELRRAVRNLLDNASRFAATAVVVTLGEVDGAVELVVADDGPGIPSGSEEEVFRRFSRVDEARTNAAGGAGLGLAITRDIVERHGGTIVVDTDVDTGSLAGTRMVLRLPAAMAAERPSG